MKAHLMVFALSAILIVSTGMTPTFGDIQSSIVITTDKASYSEGEIILVTGEVQSLYGIPVSIIVKAPNGNLVSIAQIDVGADKKFSTEITAGGALMKVEGTYTITVQYGNVNRTAETSFEFGGVIEDQTMKETTGEPIMEFESEITDTTVSVQGSVDLVGYEITGGKLLSIMTDVDAKSLIILIDATDDGSLTITIPRLVLDAVFENGEDDEFFVLVNDEEVDFDEIISSTDRILIIAFPAGTETIEIIGTFVIPEFGTIAAMILAVAIISIIAISAKSRLSIIPRY
ncbi:PEFG-CTERM sorting domain-containing protein [Marine Group I thaumarchaeote]|uniref:PEFG-CTERM sorting domain-containing protein n=1 Tax=Marine Group I thaumarchaeote TaxID=2511932 RepID=A0A7K4N4X3_9ARCH|nr:MAG: PEFG-CTERM sorting domain-containing protein [Nitrosopumilus sp. YT1]NWJ19706.1 PEFG-CTERM sorting domain-containing protein [Marine Group I thaumarchaeote]NWJ56726.1 PEFG-CTERM sorting domain-containing protein [Marine Group I thaumarchaeote]NWJ83475.1 PEFG-CTERM sorting domain-containing protein [Marine Group I thaumarchaeote]NWK00544.1 PEFG-CTERM sorting domain-containing protein [Marine Group I thaumarchaeote]